MINIDSDQGRIGELWWINSETSPVEPAIQEAAKRAVESCLSQREEVLAAFIAKHGFYPEDAIQVEQRHEDGTSSWRIERRTARHPKLPSLKEQALNCLVDIEHGATPCPSDFDSIRRALEALPE